MLEERHKAGPHESGSTHQLTLVGRARLSLDGVRNVVSFSTEEIALETTAGALLIRGQDLHLQHLNLDEGRMEVDGAVSSLAYADEGLGKKGRSFLQRLLR